MDKDQNRPRFYKWNPDKKQETGKEKVVAVVVHGYLRFVFFPHSRHKPSICLKMARCHLL